MKLERSLVVNGLVVVAALGSGAAALLTRERASSQEQSARQNNLCAELKRDELGSIHVRSGEKEFWLEAKKAADAGERSFSLRGLGPADPEASEGLLRALEIASFERRFDAAAVDRKAFGLEAPRAELTLSFAQGKQTIRRGAEAPSPRGSSYVETESARGVSVGLVKDNVLAALWPSVDELRPKTLLPLTPGELSALRFKDAGHEAELKRGAGPSWLDARGERVRRDAVERLLYELFALRAERFVDAKQADQAFAAGGVLDATLTLKGDKRFTLRVGGTCPSDPELSVLFLREPSVSAACVAGGVRQLFWNASQNLQNDGVFELHADEVETLKIDRGDKKLELTRGERGFSLRAPSRAEVALDVGNQRLQALVTSEGTRVVEPNLATLGLTLPQGKVTLHSTTLRETPSYDEVLELGRVDAEGRLAVRRVEDGAVLLLDRERARAFGVDSTLLRSPKLFDFGPSELAELELWFGAEHELLRRAGAGAFELVTPAAPSDATLNLALVQALGTLTAERWVADDDDGSFGLGTPRVRAAFTLSTTDAGPRQYTLVVGRDTPGGTYAKLAQQPGVFVVERDFVEVLTTLLLSRGAFASDPASVERVELGRAGKTLVLVRRGNDLRVESGAPLADALIAEISEALANLRPEAAVHTGAARPSEGFDKPSLTLRIKVRPGLGVDKSFRLGAADSFRDVSVYYARIDGIDATYAMPASLLRPLLAAL